MNRQVVFLNTICFILYLCLGLESWAQTEVSLGAIDPERSLLIRNLEVVESPLAKGRGPWSFQTLIENSTGLDEARAGHAVFDLWDQFYAVSELNGYELPPRSAQRLLRVWPRRGSPEVLDLSESPLRLLAIVFRTDLAEDEHAGEGRFVFGAFDPPKGIFDLTLIFEFRLPLHRRRPTVEHWQRDLAALSKLDFGVKFSMALKKLTDDFAGPSTARMQLLQIRTNEQLFGNGWDMRDFEFDQSSKKWTMKPILQEPHLSWNARASNALTQWLSQVGDSLFESKLVLPKLFRSGRAFLPDDQFKWFQNHPDLSGELVKEFNRKTCSGCHSHSTATRFMHIEPRLSHESARLSPFLEQELQERKWIMEDSLNIKILRQRLVFKERRKLWTADH